MTNTIDARTDLIQVPPGTPAEFPVARFFCEQGGEFNTPSAEGFVEEWRPHGRIVMNGHPYGAIPPVHDDTDLDAALMQQFLNISVAQQKSVLEPDSVLNDGHRETVAVRLEVGHGGSVYPAQSGQYNHHH